MTISKKKDNIKQIKIRAKVNKDIGVWNEEIILPLIFSELKTIDSDYPSFSLTYSGASATQEEEGVWLVKILVDEVQIPAIKDIETLFSDELSSKLLKLEQFEDIDIEIIKEYMV